MKRLFVQTAWKGLLMSVLFYFLFVGNVDLRAQNAVSNGNFDATLINWTANPITGGWVWVIGGIGSNGAFASNIANNSTTGTLTQSLTNVAPNGAVLSFSLNWNYSSISGTASTFQISYNGVVYGQMITKSISTSSASITPLNGATGATVTVPVSTVTANNFATASFTLPNGIPTSGILEIKMISGSCFLCADDIGVDNVFLTSCTPGTPTATVTTEPTCATSTGSVTIGNLPATGNWTL
ncbi:hypothetical protein [Dyadobacter sp. NIV53]|uniref:hypothetical protein n=1 Tax=Dyadobacter sp. NIV53 TaxID=2861765 RepID=UPI001C874341|nr:hypothetical protein [Dyadobacter sp. NIV53]